MVALVHPFAVFNGNYQWAMGNYQWAMGNYQWAMGNYQWAMGRGQRDRRPNNS